ncbi:MAG TPA: hypothetical protein VM869_35830 [Enhygromyxa sp.]|jgi:hypothetical protein|nr:hypothetical protein [Enhygromyxa sp.]
MSIILGTSNIEQVVQERILARTIGDGLFPPLIFRSAASQEPWEGHLGQTMTFTNEGLYEPDTTPRTPGVPPPFMTRAFEKYTATAQSYGKPIQVHMPSNWAAIDSLFYRDLKAMGLQAGQTMGRLARNRLYRAYLAGHAIVESTAGGGTVLTVNSVSGFVESTDPTTGFPVVTSSAAPRTFSRNGVAVESATSRIIAAEPADAAAPNGPGTITLSADVGFVAGDLIDATDASIVIRPNNATSVDGINAGDRLTMNLIQRAITSLRRDNVGPCADGYYHVHMDPTGEGNLENDNSFQRQIEGRGIDDDPYAKFAIGKAKSCLFFANNETPDEATVEHTVGSRPSQASAAIGSSDIGADIVNRGGVPIMRTIVIGGGALVEKSVDESAFMSEAGVSGKIGEAKVINGGVEIPLDGVRFILKSPQDVFNEVVTGAWSWTGDYVVPTNKLTGRTNAAFKRARVIESALID